MVSEVCRNWRKEKIKAACPSLKRQNEYQGECESSGVGYLEEEKRNVQIKNEV